MGIIALAGGNEFRDNCGVMDRRLLDLIPAAPAHVVIIPTAAVHGSPRMAAENGVRYFDSLGAAALATMIVTREHANDPVLLRPLEDADMVYLAGGDPSYLLEVLRGSALLDSIRAMYRRGGVIAGSSAGAMVLAATMRVWNKGEWVAGLGLAEKIAVLVHHEGPDAGVPQEGEAPPLILGIAEATACFSRDSRAWEVAGAGSVTVYRPDSAVRYTHGAHFSV
jgi:cyanophycinase-like exopeptidase